MGLALLELASDYSGSDQNGSRNSVWIQRLFRAFASDAVPSSDLALAEFAKRWPRITPDVRALGAVMGRGRWGRVVGSLSTDTNRDTRRGVAELCLGAGDPALASVACELLNDQDEGVAGAAEKAMLFFALVGSDPGNAAWADHATPAEHETASRMRSTWDEADRQTVIGAMAAGVKRLPEHRRERILLAALLLLEPAIAKGSGPLARWLKDRDQSSHSFLRGLLRRDESPLSRLRAWQWLGTSAVSGAAMDRVASVKAFDEHEAVLSLWHLATNPARASKLRQHEKSLKADREGILPPVEMYERLSVEARRGVAGLAGLMRMTAAKRDVACEPLLADSDPMTRHVATRSCSSRLLGDFCFDREEPIARSATMRLSVGGIQDAIGSPGAERLSNERSRLRVLLRSPHYAVRLLAEQDLACLCDEQSLSAQSRIALRRAMSVDEGWVIERLRSMLTEDEETRLFALTMAGRLGLSVRLRDPLLESVRSMLRQPLEPGVPAKGLATAVSTLGELSGREPMELLSHAAASTDQRVRANAIDSMVVRMRNGMDDNAPGLEGVLMDFKEDSWHRVRGSAVRGLNVLGAKKWKIDSNSNSVVGEQILRMLEDQRPMHRLAGAWVAHRSLPGREMRELKLWPALIARLRSLAINDLETRVRSRARLALSRTGENPIRDENVGAVAGGVA